MYHRHVSATQTVVGTTQAEKQEREEEYGTNYQQNLESIQGWFARLSWWNFLAER